MLSRSFAVLSSTNVLFEILRHQTDSSAVGWLQLLISEMNFQLIRYHRERLMAGTPSQKIYSILYVAM